MPTATCCVLVVGILLGQLSSVESASNQITGIQKVIQLLTNMEATAKAAKQAEMVDFAKFNQFCTDTIANKEAEIEKENQLIESLSAEIEKLEVQIEDLANKIDELQRGIAEDEASIAKAKTQRETDHASYEENHRDLSESVDALNRAIAALKKRSYDKKQAAEVLLQLSQSSSIPSEAQQTITAFLEMSSADQDLGSGSAAELEQRSAIDAYLQPASDKGSANAAYLQKPEEEAKGYKAATPDDQLFIKAPEASAYEFQSGGIVEVLEKLQDQFSKKKREAEKEEINSRHASDMFTQDLVDSIENAKSDIRDKTADKQEKMKQVAEDKKQLAATIADRDEDVAYLKDLKTECSDKTNSFEEKQQLRAEEIAAIGKAIEVLASPAVSGAAEKHLPTLVQKAASFGQLRRASSQSQQVPNGASQMEAINFLTGEGQRLHSHELSMLAQQMSADPFGKVKTLIKDLIERLLAETNQESEQKGFCDKELGTNKITRTKLSTTIEELTAKVDENTATIAQNSQRMATLQKEVVELNAALLTATDMRTKESAKNAETVKDAVDAQKAIQSAVAILREFYAGATTATALLQKPVQMGSEEWNALANPEYVTGGGVKTVDKGHKKGMQTFGKVYQGQQDEAGSVLGILEVVESDFASLEVETKAAESEAAKAFDDFKAATEQSIAVKGKESDMLDADRTQAEQDLVSNKRDLAANQDQLLAADRYYEKLKPSCVDTGLSYEDRAKAREDEIQSLKEALQILGGEDIA